MSDVNLKRTLGPADLPEAKPEITYVPVPEWGGQVALCSPSSLRCDQVQIQASLDAGDSPGDEATPEQQLAFRAAAMRNFHARTVALCLCDDGGSPWYDDAVAGAEQLGSRAGDGPKIKRIYERAKLLCPLTGEAVGAIEKNCDPPEESDSSGSCASAESSA